MSKWRVGVDPQMESRWSDMMEGERETEGREREGKERERVRQLHT